MTRRHLGTVLGIIVAVSTIALVGVIPLGAASHGAATNVTVQPVDAPEDRRPGISDASYKQFAHADRSIKRVDYFVVEWKAGVIGSCGPSNIEALGIDRGDDDPGTKTDEGLLAHVENTTRSKHRVVADFYDQDDFGGQSTHINASDELVSHQSNCYGNPEEPGWYQITATVNGTGWNGEQVEMTVASHYFWICDCASEQEARKSLGPPPSERSGQPTPTSTSATETRSTTTNTARSGTVTADRVTDTPVQTTSTGTASGTNDGSTGTAAGSSTATSGSTTTVGGSPTPRTATEGEVTATTSANGPGFGTLATLLACLTVVLIERVR